MANRAAIDCGSNTTRLLIVDDQDKVLARELAYTRLGKGVDSFGALDAGSLDACEEALRDFSKLLLEHNVEKLGVFATSAVRDASNADDFVKQVEHILKVSPRILSGEDEARLTYLGATANLPDGDYALIDIGGGSTEFAWRTNESNSPVFSSIDVGAVRMTERCMRSDPPTESELVEAQGQIAEAFGPVVRPSGKPTLIGVAGTVTTIAALSLGLSEYDPDKVHGSTLSRADVFKWTETLVEETAQQRMARGVPEGRAGVIAAGAMILDLAFEVFGFDQVLVSERDNLDGQVALLKNL